MFLPLQLPNINEAELETRDSLIKVHFVEGVKEFVGMTWEQRFDAILHFLINFGIKLLVVAVIFFVGRWAVRRIVKIMTRIFERRRIDRSLHTFVGSIVKVVLYSALFYIIISYLGFRTTLFIALFTVAGFAIGMALSGVFQNFAGGVMILVLKIFRVGDWIEMQGQAGTVMDIRLFNTVLRTADNKTIMMPNGGVSTSIVNNFNTARTRRVEWIVSLEYGTDFAFAQKILLKLLKDDSRILTVPAPQAVLSNLGASSVDITVRAWAPSPDYWDVFYDINAAIYKTIPEHGLSFPYSKVDVNILPSAVVPPEE